jgi:hypothetical protein
VDLIDGRQRRARKHRGDRAAAIFRHRRFLVARSESDVQASDDTLRDSATPSEEAVRDSTQRL